jgi:hypothetical protein
MNKKIQLDIIITSLRARVDGSLGLSLSTPELTAEEKVELMKLQNMVCEALISPKEAFNAPTVTVDREIDKKSQSDRIRAILFLLWKQDGEKGEFRDYYYKQTEKLIEWLKTKIDD